MENALHCTVGLVDCGIHCFAKRKQIDVPPRSGKATLRLSEYSNRPKQLAQIGKLSLEKKIFTYKTYILFRKGLALLVFRLLTIVNSTLKTHPKNRARPDGQ